MPQLQAKDIIAIIMLIGSFSLRLSGVDTFTDDVILGVAIGYGLLSVASHIRRRI